jgi:lipopolysaccharide export system protein LptA
MERHRVLLFVLCLAVLLTARQEIRAQAFNKDRTTEEKVHLISAQVAEMYELFGVSYRKVTGPARFLHNDTYILCDTAIWNTADNVIDAVGNVEIIQQGTRLKGETIHYIGDLNTAEVRGKTVELLDEEGNCLRTRYLNFNTKDSIGYFFNGGSMVDNQGTILESRKGYYYSKEKLFCFYEHVEMGTDTLRVKADSLYYHSDLNLAEFWGNVQAWHTDGFLTAGEGTYEREKELFHFMDNVFIRTNEQEIMAEDVHYDRINNSGILRRNIQVRDTTQQLLILGDRLDFRRNPDWAQVTQEPVFITYEVDQEATRKDSLFLRADTLLVFTSTYGQMDSLERVRAFARRDIPVRNKPADPAQSVMLPDSTTAIPASDTVSTETSGTNMPVQDSLEIQLFLVKTDSTFLAEVKHRGDSLFNTLEVHFFYGHSNVRVYKSDFQSVCDSMVFNSIDSVLRQYGKPVLWNQESQLSADSIQFRFSRDSLYRVDFLSKAFLISQEEEIFFHQIKADLMYAHIRDNDIFRFDAVKNAKALFYIPEDSLITSLNIKECEEMNVFLKERRAQRIIYKKSVKSDMIPLFELKKDQERLAEFNWRAPERPSDRYAITSRMVVDSPPQNKSWYKEPLFPYTLKFFPDVHARPSTLGSGTTIDAVRELNRRETENKINPFVPLQEKNLTPVLNEEAAVVGMQKERQHIPANTRRITPVLQRKQLQVQQIE